MPFNRGDFVEYRGIRFLIKDIELLPSGEYYYTLIDPWEEVWNVPEEDLILVAKYKDLQRK